MAQPRGISVANQFRHGGCTVPIDRPTAREEDRVARPASHHDVCMSTWATFEAEAAEVAAFVVALSMPMIGRLRPLALNDGRKKLVHQKSPRRLRQPPVGVP
jgi:hypothetical protein